MAMEMMNKKLSILGSATRHDVLNSLTGLFGYLELAEVKTKDETVLKYIGRPSRRRRPSGSRWSSPAPIRRSGRRNRTGSTVNGVCSAPHSALNDPRIPLDLDVGRADRFRGPDVGEGVLQPHGQHIPPCGGPSPSRCAYGRDDGMGSSMIEDDGDGHTGGREGAHIPPWLWQEHRARAILVQGGPGDHRHRHRRERRAGKGRPVRHTTPGNSGEASIEISEGRASLILPAR